MKFDRFGDPLPDGALARIGTLRYMHQLGMPLFLANNDLCFIAGGVITIWDIHTDTEKKHIGAHRPRLTDAVLSTNDRLLAVGCEDRFYVWDVARGTTLWENQSTKFVKGIGFLGGEKAVVVGLEDGTIVVLAPESGSLVGEFRLPHGSLTALRCHPTENRVAVGCPDGTLFYCDPLSGKISWKVRKHKGQVSNLSYDATGSILVSAGQDDGQVRFCNTRDGQCTHDWQVPSKIYALAVSKSNSEVALGTAQGDIYLGHLNGGNYRTKIVTTEHTVVSLDISRGGQFLAAGLGGKTGIWDLKTGTETTSTASFPGRVNALAISPCGNLLGLAGSSKLGVWNIDENRPTTFRSTHIGSTNVATFSRDGLFGSGGWDNTVRVYDKTKQQELAVFRGHQSWIVGIAFSPDGRYLASGEFRGDRPRICIWDVDQRRHWKNIEGDLNIPAYGIDEVVDTGPLILFNASQLSFSPDGQFLACDGASHAPNPCEIKLWNWRADPLTYCSLRGEILESISWLQTLTFSPDGKLLAAGYNNSIILVWDMSTFQLATRIDGHVKGVKALAFSADSRFLASGGDDSTVRLWEVGSWKEVKRFLGHQAAVTGLAFTPDNMKLISGSYDGTVLIWDAGTF